jgi:hypothetical protein
MSRASFAIVYSGYLPITEDGQSFTFNIPSVVQYFGGTGSFSIEAAGDYGPTAPPDGVEYLSWDIDGITNRSEWGSFNADSYNDNYDDNGNGVWWTRSIALDSSDISAVTEDGFLDVGIQNSFGVNYFETSSPIEYPLYVSWEFSYTPSGIATSEGNPYATELLFGDTISLDYLWELGMEPTEPNLDVLLFNGTEWETFGWELNFGGSSD